MTYLSIAPGGPRRGVHHRRPRADRPARRRHLRRDLAARLEASTRAYFERYPDDRERAATSADASTRGRPPAIRRPTDRAPVPPARHVARRQRGLRAPAPRARAAVRLERVPVGRRGGAARFARNPIYATLHESSYADGVADALVGAPPAAGRVSSAEGCFTAEHVFPWMWEESARCRAPRGGRTLLAEHPWPRLYDADRLRAQRGAGRRDDLHQRPLRRARRSPRRRRPRSAACARGSPTSTSTTGCAPTASGCSAG